MYQTLGVVLAGGLSSRMKKDKATLQRKHESMLDFSQSILKKCGVDKVVISGNNYQIKDSFKHLGPLSGILSVIEQCPTHSLLIMPIDLPLIEPSTLKQLKIIGELSQKACCYQDHPLPLYLPVNGFVEVFLRQQLHGVKAKGPSMKHLLANIPHKILATPDQQKLFNCNTPNDWRHAQDLLVKEKPATKTNVS
ncbi:molybdenum cofactor guanylyltransferase [Thalassotalea piscium]